MKRILCPSLLALIVMPCLAEAEVVVTNQMGSAQQAAKVVAIAPGVLESTSVGVSGSGMHGAREMASASASVSTLVSATSLSITSDIIISSTAVSSPWGAAFPDASASATIELDFDVTESGSFIASVVNFYGSPWGVSPHSLWRVNLDGSVSAINIPTVVKGDPNAPSFGPATASQSVFLQAGHYGMSSKVAFVDSGGSLYGSPRFGGTFTLTSSVPEAGTSALMAIGLIGVLFGRLLTARQA